MKAVGAGYLPRTNDKIAARWNSTGSIEAAEGGLVDLQVLSLDGHVRMCLATDAAAC